MNGIINLIKPPRLSSAQAVSFVKRLTRQKVGHAGTLDPEACGVLPLMVGKATRLFDYITDRDKVYVAAIAFGLATDTQDAQGQEIQRGGVLPDEQALAAVLPRFVGDIMQVPPAFSALKRDGETMYKLARQGQLVALDARPVKVDSISLLRQLSPDSYSIRVVCGKGTYIRTLCHDIGQVLHCPAHMRLLIREQSGPYHIEQGITLEELEQAILQGLPEASYLQPMDQAIAHLPRLDAPDSYWRPCLNGVPLPASAVPGAQQLDENQPLRLYCQGQLLGIYRLAQGMLRVQVMLWVPR